jgi:hypothetical protein
MTNKVSISRPGLKVTVKDLEIDYEEPTIHDFCHAVIDALSALGFSKNLIAAAMRENLWDQGVVPNEDRYYPGDDERLAEEVENRIRQDYEDMQQERPSGNWDEGLGQLGPDWYR